MNHRTLYPRLAVLICASLISCASSLLAQTERTVRILFLNGPAEAAEKIYLHASNDLPITHKFLGFERYEKLR
jgi:hypothetical protein